MTEEYKRECGEELCPNLFLAECSWCETEFCLDHMLKHLTETCSLRPGINNNEILHFPDLEQQTNLIKELTRRALARVIEEPQ